MPSDPSHFKAPSDMNVSEFFKSYPLAEWNTTQYYSWYSSRHPFAKFNFINRKFQDDLEMIKKHHAIPDEVLRLIPGAKKKNLKRKQDKTVSIVNHHTEIYGNRDVFTGSLKNAYIQHSSINTETSPTTTEASPTATGASPTATEASPTATEVPPTATEVPYTATEVTSITTEMLSDSYDIDVNASIFCTLYDSMFKLYKNQAVDLNRHRHLNGPSLIAKLYNHCINTMKDFKTLDTEERSYLHVYLSGCINLITTSHRATAAQAIGSKTLAQVINQHQPEKYHNFKNEEWSNLKLELQNVYAEKKTDGLRLFILEKRQSIYRSLPHASRIQSLSLKVCDIFEYLLNHVEYGQVDDDSEDFYSSTWKYILAVLFRGSGLTFRRGESTCIASKIDKAVNLQDNNEETKGLMGSRIDLIISGNIVNDHGNEEIIEFGSIEVKKQDISDKTANIQLNKNIRVNKSILKRLNNHLNQDTMPSFTVLGLDIIGDNAFTYFIRPYEDIVTAIKTSDEPLFIPIDKDDFQEYIFSTSLDQLLNYQQHVVTLFQDLTKASKRYKRQRATSKYVLNQKYHSPPSSPVPNGTFYTPKRDGTTATAKKAKLFPH